MKHKLIVALGALAVLTGTASSVYAQVTEKPTLSGESLNVENLTIKDEYNQFFRSSGDKRNISINSGKFNNYDRRDDGVFYDEDDGVWQISDRLELQVNEPISPPIYPTLFRQDGVSLFGNVDSLQLQYDLSR